MELSGRPLEKTPVDGSTSSGSMLARLALGGSQHDRQRQCKMASITLALDKGESPRPCAVEGKTVTIVTERFCSRPLTTPFLTTDTICTSSCVGPFGATDIARDPTSDLVHPFLRCRVDLAVPRSEL